MSRSKFYAKRHYEKIDRGSEGPEVDTGFRGGELRFRIRIGNSGSYASLTAEDAEDLADLLDEALSDQEDDPLDWAGGPE